MTQLQNQFAQAPELGMADLRFNGQPIPVEIDASETGTLLAGQSVKIVDSIGGVPKVKACDSDADEIFGFILYNIKKKSFTAGMACEIAAYNGNCIYLRATAAIARGAHLKGVVATRGGVATAVPGAHSPIIGQAFDKALADGDLIRVVTFLPAAF